ncbi:HD-GYP domain-containing protein [Azotosporobacter soli]|uniref:HD-GYP domain-containing protein n=1 Tax=Azotosporobacter soli TaxID=3055040 RepID=UPI0031FECE00
MRVLMLNEVKENMILEESISSPDGNMVLGQGTVLTTHWISRMKDWEIDRIKVTLPKAEEAFDVENLGDMLKDLLTSSRDTAPKQQSGLAKFKETRDIIKKDLQRVFVQTRYSGEVPIAEMQRLTLLIVQKLLPIKGGIWYVHEPGRGEEYLYRHALDVAVYTGLLATWLGQSENEIKEAVYAGLLHDIGKSQVYHEILTKPEKLSVKETMMAKVHVTHSYRLLNELPGVPPHISNAIFQHHERLNGEGYPRALSGEAISPLARMLAIADVYDALTSDRPYRKAISQLSAAQVMWTQERSGLDEQLLMLFIGKIRESLLNEEVILNDGRRAKIAVFPELPETKPILELADGTMVNLATDSHLSVKSWLWPDGAVIAMPGDSPGK